MAGQLRVRSHIVGASCFSAVESQIKELKSFYSKVFPRNQGTSNVDVSRNIRLCEASTLERLGVVDRAMWVPHVAVDPEIIEDTTRQLNLFFRLSNDPLHEHGTSFVVTDADATSFEMLPFVLVGVHEKLEPFERANTSAPFPSQPEVEGVVNWTDLLVTKKENLRKVARLLHEEFGWNVATPLAMPNDLGEYITLLNDTGLNHNRHKVCGLLPKGVLLPKLAREAEGPFAMSVPFLSVASMLSLQQKCEMIEKNGGEILLPPVKADGDVAIIRDPHGGVVGLYHRTDEWEEVKPTTVILEAAEIDTAESLQMGSSKQS
jgi:predicted enzyme related to lactoylglutathione lyase